MNQNKTFSKKLVLLVWYPIIYEISNLRFLQIPLFIITYRLYPFFRQWHGFMFLQVESHHDRLTDTFYLVRFRVYYPLDEMKTLRAYLGDSRLHSDMV